MPQNTPLRERGFMNFIARLIATTLAVAIAVWAVPGIGFVGIGSAAADTLMFAVVLALLNMAVKPVLQVLSLPITILTFGIFYLVVNTSMIYLASAISGSLFGVDFYITSFDSAFLASIIISIASSLLTGLLSKN